MTAFIHSAEAISPQKTFASQGFPTEIMDYPDASYLRCIEPAYRDYLDPMASRRMSRIVKMGVCAALACLRNAGTARPDAIITGTGLGCLEDTEKFLGSLYTLEERLLNPTPFIQSTHNTVAGAIAMATKCHGYNTTYTHRGVSFESALTDALIQANLEPGAQILAGSFDEVTPVTYAITRRLGMWKKRPAGNLGLVRQPGRGTLAGEGVAFFLLSGSGKQAVARLAAVRTIFAPAGAGRIEDELSELLMETGISLQDLDLAILGMNGDPSGALYYDHLVQGPLSHTPLAAFKHLCGEYDTASSFALWLACVMIREGHVPEAVRIGERKPARLNHILIYNHLRGTNHGLLLISSC